MVSVYRSPPPDQDFLHFRSFYMSGDPSKMPAADGGKGILLPMAPEANAADDANKKIRKPYTITKSRESWSEQEHDKFLEALQLFDRDWKKIEAFIGSKTVIQETPLKREVVPVALFPETEQRSSCRYAAMLRIAQVETGYAVRRDPFSVPSNPISSSPLSSWSYNVVPAGYDVGLASVANNYSSSSNDSTPRVWKSNEMDHEVKVKQCNTTKDMPDFAQVYGFIGSVFDPTATDHLQRLRKMEPINVETVLMLMKNLCVNLATPEFEDHVLGAEFGVPLFSPKLCNSICRRVVSSQLLKTDLSSEYHEAMQDLRGRLLYVCSEYQASGRLLNQKILI
ncbi:hypothetical protein SASPL_137274 [Salvia splendens]|uniref:SANT domain-containing protein n=1 Tax=Salvia splendens TaxID=180675 RepID=A0A8X8WUM7_SALSN|nr:hypothetical protein SASPL_137274 [Salvia splendens]